MRLPFLPKKQTVEKRPYAGYHKLVYQYDLTNLRKDKRYQVIEEDTYFHEKTGGVITLRIK